MLLLVLGFNTHRLKSPELSAAGVRVLLHQVNESPNSLLCFHLAAFPSSFVPLLTSTCSAIQEKASSPPHLSSLAV